MLILGIDPGTQILGYSLLDTDSATPTILAMDVLYLKKIPEFNLRIRKIFESTTRIIDSFHPDHLAIEAPFFGKNVQSMLKLGRAQGVAIAAAISRDLSITEYEPSVIKQHITGNGNASKEQVAAILQSILHFDQSPQYLDATDALAVAYTCHLHLTNPIADLQHQLAPKKKKSKSTKKQWSEFITSNPDLVL
ncbi:MAG: crossover junction endodeoxyribonuclease RuvC [Bacteroidales bacterium]|nr:crossover junction endodeoxyribonuclease RuvC [Bacteroidales bacterium]